jgi:hypothetical protein
MEWLIETALAIFAATIIGLVARSDRKMGRPPMRLNPVTDVVLEILGDIL